MFQKWKKTKMELMWMSMTVAKEKETRDGNSEVGAPTSMSGGVNGFGVGGNARSFSPVFHRTPMSEPAMARVAAKR
ncbi:MAG: hypothetical protein V1909_06735 [Candidatus Micrarchaeota archaeon]